MGKYSTYYFQKFVNHYNSTLIVTHSQNTCATLPRITFSATLIFKRFHVQCMKGLPETKKISVKFPQASE